MPEDESRHFGSGWLSGTLSSALGLLGLGAVLCFRHPALLTMPELRALYPVPYVRALLHVVLVASFALGVISVCLLVPPMAVRVLVPPMAVRVRRRKTLGVAGIALTLIAAAGGPPVPEGYVSQFTHPFRRQGGA